MTRSGQERIGFTFDGRRYTGRPGDTLASALIANGVHLVGRSFKYHRPRGILAAGSEEPNALVTIGEGGAAEPNSRATTAELYDGLVATSQNRWPSLALDAGALAGMLSPLFPAGFYYKTFMGGPRGAWTKLYEPIIRRMAGLGRAATAPDPDCYDKRHAHCDLLVIGGGPAGLAAATAAPGERVILIDERATLGGSAHWTGAEVADVPDSVRILTRTTAFGLYDANLVMAVERIADHLAPAERCGVRQRLWQIRARRIVLATGAHEQPLVFGNNDLPGIMLSSAAATYARQHGVLVGRDIVVATAGDSGHAVTATLAEAGARIVAIVDARPGATSVWPLFHGHIVEAQGRQRVTGVTLSNGVRLACDAVAMSGGWQPALHLHAHVGGRTVYDEARGWFVAAQPAPGLRLVGGAAGAFDDHAVAVPPPSCRAKAFVDFQNDVTVAGIDLAAREGFVSVEHLKRYTTTGMATDQGKTSNVAAIRRLGTTLGIAPGAVGTTGFRPPYTPVTFGALAGRNLGDRMDPARVTPMHGAHVAAGAVFEDVGQWKRPWYFPRDGEDMAAAVARECRAVRHDVGMFDASTLGKIDIAGVDATRFLELVTTNAWAKLGIGRCRYHLMLGDDGMVMDDGVTTRTAANRYLMTTTTAGAARVLDHLEDLLQTEWPELRVHLTSVTEHWAAIVVTGPRARDVLARIATGVDLAAAAFAHLSMREGRVAGHSARIYRISFTGELGFEIHVDARHALAVWEAVAAAGASDGITRYGTEAMHVLRAEKGYIIIGQETDGSVTPDDLGLARMIGRAKGDFIGRRSLLRADTARGDRKQLVGLRPSEAVPEGAQLTAAPGGVAPVAMLGHVTSAYVSDAAGGAIALALVANGRARLGETVWARFDRRAVAATIVDPVFVDPEGVRLNG